MNIAHQTLPFAEYTVLIIDDSPTNLGVVFDLLDGNGFTVMVAQDGESGLDKIQYAVPDIILLDALMPGLDGFEVCRRLKQDERTSATPVIFMTGLTSVEDKVKGFEAGAVDYVTKPVQEDELLARIVTHLRIHTLTQQLQSANGQLQQEIGERQRAEQALTAYQDQLEEQVEQRTAQLSQTNQQLRYLTARLAEVEEAERRRLARELHDRVSQDLGILDINLNIIQNKIGQTALSAKDAEPLQTHLQDSLELVQQVARHVYDVMADLRSPVLDDYGVVAALKAYGVQFTARTGINVSVQGAEEVPRLALAVESALFRIAQEALTNVAKHAQATKVTITYEQRAGVARLTITDDGIGFEQTSLSTPKEGQGWGLVSMRERAEATGGRCEIKTQQGEGTQVVVEIGRRE